MSSPLIVCFSDLMVCDCDSILFLYMRFTKAYMDTDTRKNIMIANAINLCSISFFDLVTQSVIYLFRNLLTKYTCPAPVTFVVVDTSTEPSGLLMAVCFSSNSPSSMAFCVGWL